MGFTPQQKQAATKAQHTAAHDKSRHVRLVAGPGTGKSATVEERVAWLVHNSVPTNQIWAVSFTRAAARDLKDRIYAFGVQHSLPELSEIGVTTLHALAL